MNRRTVFIKDPINKHSIRVLMAAYEKAFPNEDYFVTDFKKAYDFVSDNDIAIFSSASRSIDKNIELADALKSKSKDIISMIGGPHASARANSLVDNFNIVATGEGELLIEKIIIDIHNDNIDYSIIEGEKVLNLDDFHVFPRKKVSLGPIELIRGCISKCTYCQTPKLFSGALRYRSVDFIANEIEFALSRKGYAEARFIAPDASSYYYNKGVNLEAIENLLSTIRGLIKDNGKIFFGTFPSELDPAGVTKELIDLMVRYCDNKLIVIGLQSASDKMQKIMKRRSGIKETERAIELFLDNKFEIVVDLIFGLPYEDEFTYLETLKFIDRWHGKITIHAHPYDPLPGSLWENEKSTTVPDILIKKMKSLQGIGKVFGNTV